MNSRSRVVVTVVAATISVLAAATGSASGQVTLQYRWNKGEEVRYRFVQQTTTIMDGLPDGSSRAQETRMSQVVRTLVDDVAADGTATLRSAYESARWENKAPTGTMVVDTTSPDTPSTGVPDGIKDMLTAMVGETFVVVMAPNGQVHKVEGIDSIREKMFKSFRQEPLMAPMLEALKNNFSEDAIRNAFAQGSVQLPDRPLRPGDSWESTATATNPVVGRQTTTMRFTLKDVESTSGSRLARIATRVTTQSTEEPAAPLPGMKIRVADRGGEGELVFDVTNGRLFRSVTRTTMSMEVSMPLPDGTVMNVQGNATSSTSVELLQP